MSHDERLVEAACAVYSRALTDTLDPKKAMCAALDAAINASAAAEARIAELEQELSFLANSPEKVTIVLAGEWDAAQARIAELERELDPLRKGTHWPAPWKMTRAMHDAYNSAVKAGFSAGRFWSELRNVSLAEQAKEDRR